MTTAHPSTDAAPRRFEVKATAESHFAWLRTRLSLERTLMSWVRTGVALIGFGFTIVQFFDRMQSMSGVTSARLPGAPRYLGLALIGCGVLALAISIQQYRWAVRYLSEGEFSAIAGTTKRTPLIAVAVILMLIGTAAFSAVLLRLV